MSSLPRSLPSTFFFLHFFFSPLSSLPEQWLFVFLSPFPSFLPSSFVWLSSIYFCEKNISPSSSFLTPFLSFAFFSPFSPFLVSSHFLPKRNWVFFASYFYLSDLSDRIYYSSSFIPLSSFSLRFLCGFSSIWFTSSITPLLMMSFLPIFSTPFLRSPPLSFSLSHSFFLSISLTSFCSPSFSFSSAQFSSLHFSPNFCFSLPKSKSFT